MEKETVHRRHWLIPGVPPTAMAPGLHKVVTEASELQRSKSIGGYPPTGEPVAPIEKLLQEFEGEDLEKESKGEAENISCQMILEDDKEDQDKGDLKRVDQDKDKEKEKEKEKEKVEQECEKKEKEEQIKTGQDEAKRDIKRENYVLELNTTLALEKKLESLKLHHLVLETEMDLSKIESALTEEKSSKAKAGDTSEDESKTMWICCFPLSSKKKSKEKA
ncbi:uncharacterized protein C13orf46 homolog isoform X2 [Trichosurus vulpecula]|uniref:uncharacterized protein C13orf46 homolog isoform X2 n=1 Tax=Trichosurus vulpecula TaxID=9337 RepID=UPI00186B50E7|nr:uncharacterized protein C13orf46 homolog isoform X2 [Trichosurus vulpecula]